MTNGWRESAAAWIAEMGERGDFSREFILDPALRDRLAAEMARVLRQGGTLLIANLTSFSTAGMDAGLGWAEDAEGEKAHFRIDDYLQEKPVRVSWRGISVTNWHRPLGAYFSALLGAGLRLEHFSEPTPRGCAPEVVASYMRMPYFLLMEWSKDRAPRAAAGPSF